MAKLAKLLTSSGYPAWVNADNVARVISFGSGKTRLVLMRGDDLIVQGKPDIVAMFLSDPGTTIYDRHLAELKERKP